MTTTRTAQTAFTPLGGPTVLIEIAGLRLLTDPTFDPAGDHANGPRVLTKTSGARFTPDAIAPIDAVLLSHDQHADNLDNAGRDFLKTVPVTVTTALAANRLGATCVGLVPWQSHRLGDLTITAVPAQHGPDGTDHLTGPVIGFLLATRDGLTIYVSGDNASTNIVTSIAGRIPQIDAAILFAGAGRTAVLDGTLTLTGAEAAQATDALGRPSTLVVHTDEWAHLTEGYDAVTKAFNDAGTSTLLIDHTPGTRSVLRSSED